MCAGRGRSMHTLTTAPPKAATDLSAMAGSITPAKVQMLKSQFLISCPMSHHHTNVSTAHQFLPPIPNTEQI